VAKRAKPSIFPTKDEKRWRTCVECSPTVLYALTGHEIEKLKIEDLMRCPMHRELNRIERTTASLTDRSEKRPNAWGME